MKEYTPKLVRNKVPDKIKNKWEECKYFIADTSDKYKFLVLKIIEELEEVFEAKEKTSIYEEISDLQQVTLDLLNFIILAPFEEYSEQENFIDVIDENSYNPYSFYGSYYKLWKNFWTISSKNQIISLLQSLNNRLNDFIDMNKFDSETIEEYRLNKLKLLWWFDDGIILTHY